jgi:DNA-binding IclR family transcriptional regulator
MSKQKPAQADDRQFVTALARGLDILRCFDRPKLELTVSEIARRVGLTQPTAWRLCYTLIECGFLVRSPSGAALRIGAPAITLGYAATQGLDAPAVALPYMQRILDQSGGSVTLSLRQGGEIMAIEQVNGDFVVRNQRVGWRAPLDTVSSGLAVLAALPEAERDAAIGLLVFANADRRQRHLDRIQTATEAFRRHGVVRLDGILDGQYTAVAVPLFETDTAPAAQWALTCGGLTGRWTDAGLAQAAALLAQARGLLVPAFAALAG